MSASSRRKQSDAIGRVVVVRPVPLGPRACASACENRARVCAEFALAGTSSSLSSTSQMSEKKPCGAQRRTQPQRLARLYVCILRHVKRGDSKTASHHAILLSVFRHDCWNGDLTPMRHWLRTWSKRDWLIHHCWLEPTSPVAHCRCIVSRPQCS